MIYSPQRRRNNRGKLLLSLLCLVLVVAGLIWGIGYLRRGSSGRACLQIPGRGDGMVAPWEQGYLVVDSDLLICVDDSGDTLWQVNLPMTGMQAQRWGNNTVVWGGNYVCLVDQNGLMAASMREMPGRVTLCAVGKSQYAVICVEEGQYRMLVYDFNGNEVDNERYPDQTVIRAGFYGSDMSQLWVMTVDAHGTRPITRLNTYQPGKTTSGAISSVDEVGYYAVIRDKVIHFVGTHYLSTWEQPSTQLSEKSIYGWSLQSVLDDDKGLHLLFAPANSASDVIGALWYMPPTGEDVMLSLPAGCFAGIVGSKRLVAVTAQGYYSMTLTGGGLTFYRMDFPIDCVMATKPGRSFVVRSGHTLYIVPLP